MQNLVWFGNPFFVNDLEACGWGQVFAYNPPEFGIYSWDRIVAMAGFQPDVLVVADKSLPPFVLGMEDFPCLTVFYSVDSHIHSWHPLYAQGFDACLVSLYDHLESFAGKFLQKHRIFWSPPYSHPWDKPRPEIAKTTDCLFVGTNNAELMPARAAFLQALGEQVPDLRIIWGDYGQLFPQARVLINQVEHADLNFRIFEALGCGGCLVTPRIHNGFDKLFIDGEDLVAYVPGDAGDAADKINFLLRNPDLREYIGQTGMEKINAAHKSIHRAQAFTDHMCDLAVEGMAEIIARRLDNSADIRREAISVPYLLWAKEMDNDADKSAYLAAARGEFGLKGLS